MATAGSLDPHSVQVVVAKAKTLINAQLKQILRTENLPVSGAKAVMQERIINIVNQYARSGDLIGFDRMKVLINNPNSTSMSPHNNIGTSSTPPQNGTSVPRQHNAYSTNMSSTAYGQVRPMFRESPFYSIIEPLTPVLECKVDQPPSVREATRDQLECKITLRPDIVERITRDSALRVMVYAAAEPVSPFSQVDIAFPYQVEIRVNTEEVKSNLRGLKNKPGSTRPADITNLLRKRVPGYENTMTVIYALTNKKYYIVVNLVKQHPPEALVTKLETGKFISREQVIREMVSKAQDTDIVATSSIMSLKCPLSTLRISVPCRSTICLHNQCFDALSFLQLQEQAPTWTCPVCNKVISFVALQVDRYVDDILRSTPRSVEQVTIEPDGNWFQINQKETPTRTNGAQSSDDDDDDLVEIHNLPRLNAIKDEAFPTPTSMARTPPHSSREQSLGSGAPRLNSNKRPIAQVIDLTFSSDDEEGQHPKVAKRQDTQLASNDLTGAYNASGIPIMTSFSRPGDKSFSLPKLAPARPPEPVDYRNGSAQF